MTEEKNTTFNAPDYGSYPAGDAILIAFIESVRTAIVSNMTRGDFLEKLRGADMTYERLPRIQETPTGQKMAAVVRSVSMPQESVMVREWYAARIDELRDAAKQELI